MKILIILATLILTACSPLAELTPSVMDASRRVLATPQATQGATATQTPDYIQTAAYYATKAEGEKQNAYSAQQQSLDAQATSQAAMVAVVAFTAQHEAVQLGYVEMTRQAERDAIAMMSTKISLTQQAAQVTQTYQPTADAKLKEQLAMEGTRQANQSGLMTQVAEEPARIQQINNAENLARFGWMDYFVKVLATIAVCALSGGLLIVLYIRTEPKKQTIAEPEQPYIIPLEVDRSNGGYYATLALVPVPIETLVTFADGIIQRGMTPAIDPWQGIIKRRELEPLRRWLVRVLMAQEVKKGEITIIAKGVAFLAQVSETGECPLPYRCIETKIDPPPPWTRQT